MKHCKTFYLKPKESHRAAEIEKRPVWYVENKKHFQIGILIDSCELTLRKANIFLKRRMLRTIFSLFFIRKRKPITKLTKIKNDNYS